MLVLGAVYSAVYYMAYVTYFADTCWAQLWLVKADQCCLLGAGVVTSFQADTHLGIVLGPGCGLYHILMGAKADHLCSADTCWAWGWLAGADQCDLVGAGAMADTGLVVVLGAVYPSVPCCVETEGPGSADTCLG